MGILDILKMLSGNGAGMAGPQTIPGIGGNMQIPGMTPGYGDDPLARAQGMGLPQMGGSSGGAPPAPSSVEAPRSHAPGIMSRVMSGLLGPTTNYGGILNPQDEDTASKDARMAMFANLLASSGPSDHPTSLGQVLGGAINAGRGAQSDSLKAALQAQLMQSQIAKNNQGESPSSVREYEYAKKNGYPGSFQDWTTIAGQTSRPSNVQEWEFFSKLPPDQQRRYLEMRRNPNFKVADVQGAPTVVTGTPGGGVQTTPLSTTQQEVDAAAKRKGAESQAGALGTAEGNIAGGIQTKGANATTVNSLLNIADPLIDVATGSTAGAAYDSVSKFFGGAPDGAKAIASLQVLQAGLMTNMPRMEGPQSDRDVELYQKAAGQIGDPSVPRDIKKAALGTIREIQKKYEERAAGAAGATGATTEKPKTGAKKRYNPATGKIE